MTAVDDIQIPQIISIRTKRISIQRIQYNPLQITHFRTMYYEKSCQSSVSAELKCTHSVCEFTGRQKYVALIYID